MDGNFNVIGAFSRNASRGFKNAVTLDVGINLEMVEFATAGGFVAKFVLRCGEGFENKVSECRKELRIKFRRVEEVYNGLG